MLQSPVVPFGQCAHRSHAGLMCAFPVAALSRFCSAHSCPVCLNEKSAEAPSCPQHGGEVLSRPATACQHVSRHGFCEGVPVAGARYCESHLCPVCRGDKAQEDPACVAHHIGSPVTPSRPPSGIGSLNGGGGGGGRCHHRSAAHQPCLAAPLPDSFYCKAHTCRVCKKDKPSNEAKCTACRRPATSRQTLFTTCRHDWRRVAAGGKCDGCGKELPGRGSALTCAKCRMRVHEHCQPTAPPPPLIDGVPVPVTKMPKPS